MDHPMNYVKQVRHLGTLKGSAREQYREEMLTERAQEISAYLSEPVAPILDKMKQGILLTKQLWEKMNPQTEQQIYEFYTKMDTYIYELMFNECMDSRVEQTDILLKKIEQYHPRNVLVYGCGVGSEVIPILETYPQMEVMIADVPSWHFKFCIHRLLTRSLNAQAILIKLNTFGSEIPKLFDMIVCFDVFEHVVDAEALAKNLYEKLNSNGVLLAEFLFNRNSGRKPEKLNTHPLHIERNKEGVLLRGAHWKSYLKRLGFESDWVNYGSQWMKVLRKPNEKKA